MPSGYAFRDLDSNNDSKSKYRISLFWKQNTVTLRQHSPEHCFIDGNNHKVAVRVDVNLFDGLPISVYVAHWTSRLYAGPDARLRGDIAKDLRQRIDDSLQRAAASQVIVMGDFNDNPFDISLTRYLRATRDINEARKDPELLFNPFWRSLIGVKPYFIGAGTERSSGSYRHKKLTDSHKWHVFDQIIVSHGLLGPSGWHLNELATGVLDQTELHGISLESKSSFDHYPVVALFEKDAQE